VGSTLKIRDQVVVVLRVQLVGRMEDPRVRGAFAGPCVAVLPVAPFEHRPEECLRPSGTANLEGRRIGVRGEPDPLELVRSSA
jgi:hypothetical protein